MSDFATLSLRPSLVVAAEALGFDEPTRLQRAAVPVIRRGGNVVLHASSGAGLTMTWALPLLDRLATSKGASEDVIQAVVVATTDARASEVAQAIVQMAQAAVADQEVRALRIRALTRGWSDAKEAHVLVASLGGLVQSLNTSELKLGATRAIILENVPALNALEGDSALDALMVSLPADAQRIATISEEARSHDRWLETHVRKALHFPSKAGGNAAFVSTGSVSYLVVPGAAKPDTLASLLGRPRPTPPIVWTPTAARASTLESILTQRGFSVTRNSEVHADAILSHGMQPAPGTRIAYDAPFDAEGLLALEPEHGLVMVEPREIPHVRQIARRAGRELRAVGRERPGRDALAAFRADIRRALQEEDLELHLTALEPLFADFPAEEVAAALSALARRRAPAAAAPAAANRGATPFVRLFVSMGQRDGIRTNDLVGVITGEAGIAGERIGRIEIRDTFSVIEIDPDAAQTVIRKLNGTTVRGRSLRVDYDRRPGARTATTRRRVNKPPK